jgi:hypothetical protein
LGTLNILLKEPFFTKGNLVNSVIATTMIGFFASRERKKRALKSKK